MKLRTQISLLLFMFGLVPLLVALAINVPVIFDRIEALYHKAYLQNLRAEFSDFDQHLARRHEMVRMLAKLPEPGMFTQGDAADAAALEAARTGYLDWVNQVLSDQLDITRIFFLDETGATVFSMQRDAASAILVAGIDEPGDTGRNLHDAAQHLAPGAVLNGPIEFDAVAGREQPGRFMQMGMVSPVLNLPPDATRADEAAARGSVIVFIDMGGLANAYRGYYWALNDGSYLGSASGESREDSAFDDFPGLDQLFARGELDLWEYRDQQVLWVPLFMTGQSGPLWVGRSVDASPLDRMMQTLLLTVAVIMIGLLAVVFIVARLIAYRSERFGRELTDGISRVLEHDEPVKFIWRRPQELSELGDKLTRLAQTNAGQSQALHAYAHELETSNRYKSEFLANVSHELRTPLNSILLLSKMLAESLRNSDAHEDSHQAEVIHDAGTDLKALIDNILDLSRIESGQVEVEFDDVVVSELLASVADLMRPQFDEHRLRFDVVIDDDFPAVIRTDASKLRQVLLNFLSNAIKFTPAGSVTLAVGPGRTGAGIEYPVSFSVTDTGIGIEPAKHALVFGAFRQADGSTNRRFGGTGLGLAISRELAGLMGGEIDLESAPGNGSTFTVYLPLSTPSGNTVNERRDPGPRQTADIPQPPPGADYRGGRVLLVDDDVRNLLALTPLLEGWNLEVMAAGDVDEAMETLLEEDPFGVVLCGVTTPDADGWEFVRQLRTLDGFSRLPVVALADRTDGDACAAATRDGANFCIVKPVDPVELHKVLLACLDDQAATMKEDRAG